MSDTKGDINIASAAASNYTTPGYITIRDGFNPANPNVGTETHEFKFLQDPWPVTSTTGAPLITLSTIVLSVSKVFNPNNTTDSFLILSWIPEYIYHPRNSDQPTITLTLKDKNSGILGAYSLLALERKCGKVPAQSRKQILDALIFDRISAAAFTFGESSWAAC